MSLIVNVLLIIGVFGIRIHYHKMIFQALYDITTFEVRFHERILAELRSEDEYKIETVKTMLRKIFKTKRGVQQFGNLRQRGIG